MCPYFVLKATSQPPQLWNIALPDAVARSEPHHGASLRMALGRYCQRASPPDGRDIYPGITCQKKMKYGHCPWHPWPMHGYVYPEGKGTTRIQHHRAMATSPDLKFIKAADDGPFPERFKTRVLEQSQMFCPLWGPQFVEVSWCTHSTLSSRNPRCETYLGPAGFSAVQISPPTEHVIGDSWSTRFWVIEEVKATPKLRITRQISGAPGSLSGL